MCNKDTDLKTYVIMIEYDYIGHDTEAKLFIVKGKNIKEAYIKFVTDNALLYFDPFRYENFKVRMFDNDLKCENAFNEISDLALALAL